MSALWVRIDNEEIAGKAVVPADSLRLWEARGWVAVGEPSDDRATLAAAIEQEAIDAAEQAETKPAAARRARANRDGAADEAPEKKE